MNFSKRWLTAKIQTMVVKLQGLNLAFDASKSFGVGRTAPMLLNLNNKSNQKSS